MSDQRRRILELDAVYQELCAVNGEINSTGQQYIDELESHVLSLSAEIERLREDRRTRWRGWIRSARRLAGFR
jgi:outer membrane murein-binding lipoprotein Lpp